jgi:hypothetical protein
VLVPAFGSGSAVSRPAPGLLFSIVRIIAATFRFSTEIGAFGLFLSHVAGRVLSGCGFLSVAALYLRMVQANLKLFLP